MNPVSLPPLTVEQVERLREGLTRQGWSQSQLAEAADVRPSTISAMLNRESGPRSGTLTDVCRALMINKAYVMLGIEPKWVDHGTSQSSTELTPVTDPPPGVERWLSSTIEGRSASQEERERLRGVPWPQPDDQTRAEA